MSDSDNELVERFDDVCKRVDDVKALEALAEEVGVKTLINAGDRVDDRCLHKASFHDRPKLARQLIVWGADVEAKDSLFGWTPLFTSKSAEMVRLLVQEGGAKVNVLSKDGYSPLSYTADSAEATEAMLKEGALVMFGECSPLVRSAVEDRVDALKVLLDRRGFVRVIEWTDETYRRTAREAAVSRGRDVTGMVALLDEALVVAKVWERRLEGVRVGLAAADGRMTRRSGGGAKKEVHLYGKEVDCIEWSL